MSHLKLLSIPPVFGTLLLAIGSFDLWQFREGAVDVSTMLSRESPIVLIGFGTSVVALVFALVSIVQRKWLKAMFSFISAALFFACFILGGVFGAAYLNAT